MLHRLPIFVIVAFLALFSLTQLDFFSTNLEPSSFKCPPCGCALDQEVFSESGKCSACSMQRYRVEKEYVGLARLTGPILENVSVTLYSKFIYPAFILGFFLGILSLVRLNGKSLNPFLGSLLLVLALYGFKNQLYGVSYGLSGNFRLLFVPISFIMLMGPLAFLYIKSITESFYWKAKYTLHFIPAAIFFIGYLILLLSPDEIKQRFMTTPFEPFFGHLEQLAAVLTLLVYLFFSGKQVQNLTTDSKEKVKFKWVKRFHVFFIGLSVVWLFLIIINFELFEMGVATLTYNPLWVAMSFIIYWVLIEVMLNPKLFFTQFFHHSTNGYSLERLNVDKEILLQKMSNERPYLDPSLSLDKLANMMDMNPKYLSLVLNNGFNKNFYEFINQYRIEAVKELLVSPQLKHLTIEAIANEAGFNSKSSFNSVFKKYTNLTPKEYLRLNHMAIENGEPTFS